MTLGWQWSSPDFSSGSGNVQPDPTFFGRGTPKINIFTLYNIRYVNPKSFPIAIRLECFVSQSGVTKKNDFAYGWAF